MKVDIKMSENWTGYLILASFFSIQKIAPAVAWIMAFCVSSFRFKGSWV